MKNLINKTVIALMLFTICSCSDDDLPDAYPSEDLNYETQTVLELPFNEEWWIFWGGRSVEENYHAATKIQRFAIDVVQRVSGNTHTGNGSQNEDYYCFGKRLNAPGSGKIVTVRGGVSDNIPGQLNGDFPEGNYIVIDHENGEYSMLAHFKEGSIVVSVGGVVV